MINYQLFTAQFIITVECLVNSSNHLSWIFAVSNKDKDYGAGKTNLTNITF